MAKNSFSVITVGSNFLVTQGIVALCETMTDFNLVPHGKNSVLESINKSVGGVELLVYTIDKLQQEQLNEIYTIVAKTKTEVLLVIGELEKKAIQQSITYGVKGVITQQCSEKEIKNAIESTARGDRFMCSKVLEVLMKEDDSKLVVPSNQTLSPREKEVLTLITRGKTTIQIADILHVSVHTINSHRKNMLKKFNLKSPIELIVLALENNLIDK